MACTANEPKSRRKTEMKMNNKGKVMMGESKTGYFLLSNNLLKVIIIPEEFKRFIFLCPFFSFWF
jgi:hypothetical protein